MNKIGFVCEELFSGRSGKDWYTFEVWKGMYKNTPCVHQKQGPRNLQAATLKIYYLFFKDTGTKGNTSADICVLKHVFQGCPFSFVFWDPNRVSEFRDDVGRNPCTCRRLIPPPVFAPPLYTCGGEEHVCELHCRSMQD